jgi:hypothetical protein
MRFPFRQFSALTLALLSLPAAGQPSQADQQLPAISSLRVLTQNSGYIFDGTVLSVQAVPNDDHDLATMQITFRVEQAIRGTRAGQILTIREWAGLWNSGERYHVGERLLLFLYSPSTLGLTSPVGGAAGRFAVDSGGNAVIDNGRLPALPLDPASRAQLRDRKRVNARALALAIQRADTE